jgi:hypothetical protein
MPDTQCVLGWGSGTYVWGGDRVDRKYLRELNEIFHYRGDAQVILSLATRPPLRFTQVARAIIEDTGERLGDPELTRSLQRLEAGHLILAAGPKRQHLYRLSNPGQEKADLLSYILRALELRDDEPPPPAPEAPDRPSPG